MKPTSSIAPLASDPDAVLIRRCGWCAKPSRRSQLTGYSDHNWLLRMLAHRIADPRVLRLIGQWLRAGILEGGVYADTVEGTRQGAGMAP